LSNASPKVDSYPFTTLVPSVGVIDYPDDFRTVTMADVPGLIEGAAENRGLGHRFLRHVERCRLLLFLIDMASTDGRDPCEDFEHLRKELRDYDEDVASKPFMVVGNKSDEDVAGENLARFKKAFPECEPLFISAVLEDGLETVRRQILEKLS
jgi:GTP-binding protein